MGWMCTSAGLFVALAFPSENQKDGRASAPNGRESTQSVNQQPQARKIPIQTMGGMQFWADRYLFCDWRIQHNVRTGRFRLLDGSLRDHFRGSEAACLDVLQQIRAEESLHPQSGTAVLMLHGLGRTRHSMRPLGKSLAEAGFVPYYLEYPSTRLHVREHAENLHRVISRLEGPEEIHLIGHSMGGLVIRAYFAAHHDKRIKRIVMLGTPNQGALRADYWAENWAFQLIAGPAGQELVTGKGGIAAELPATLPVEVGILAGGKKNETGYSRRIPGDDDGTVSVASTRLAAAHDWQVISGRHSFLMNYSTVHRYCARFLQHGYFISESERKPITENGEKQSE